MMDEHNPATKEFELYCDDDYKNSIISSMGALGSFLGFIIFPMLSDNKGPRIALISSWFTCITGNIIMAVANNYYLLLIGYFLSGLGANPAITLHFTFINDHSSIYIFNILKAGKFREFTCIGI